MFAKVVHAPLLAMVAVFIMLSISSVAASGQVAMSHGRESDLRGELIVYTANQEWLSRIYLLRPDGSVYDYHEYEFYRFVGLEVVDNEIYAAEAFAPRVYRVDIYTGDLELVIDDWSLYYFYNIVFDGSYFYLNEWDMNRYDSTGDKDGTASYDGDVYGSAWDGEYLYNLDEDGLIRCWDVSGWPTLIEISANNIAPPSPNCRGLWYDGEYFWTAESSDGVLGYIYCFDHEGQVITQVLEPAFSGWGVCKVSHNFPPGQPSAPIPADQEGDVPVDITLSWECSDPDGDPITHNVYFGDSASPGLVSQGQSEDWYQPAAQLENETTYFWRVIAFDSQGDSTIGLLWSFTTATAYLCGDADGNDIVNISDAVFLISYIFGGGPPPDPFDAGDVDCNEIVNISDVVYLIAYIFGGGPGPCAECP